MHNSKNKTVDKMTHFLLFKGTRTLLMYHYYLFIYDHKM